MFEIKFPIKDILKWSKQYVYDKPDLEDEIIRNIVPRVRSAGYLNKQQFLKVCYWKTPRSKSRCDKNEEQSIIDITRIALNHPNEKIRIEVLTLLNGVKWPTASVFLHFFHKDRYPILDFRALWSLGVNSNQVQYDFLLWSEYVKYCRWLSDKSGLDMRVIDKGLWAYSNINQK